RAGPQPVMATRATIAIQNRRSDPRDGPPPSGSVHRDIVGSASGRGRRAGPPGRGTKAAPTSSTGTESAGPRPSCTRSRPVHQGDQILHAPGRQCRPAMTWLPDSVRRFSGVQRGQPRRLTYWAAPRPGSILAPDLKLADLDFEAKCLEGQPVAARRALDSGAVRCADGGKPVAPRRVGHEDRRLCNVVATRCIDFVEAGDIETVSGRGSHGEVTEQGARRVLTSRSVQ